MGWLFGKKKQESKVPFPAARESMPREGTFQFQASRSERVIAPQEVQEAVGLMTLPREELPPVPQSPLGSSSPAMPLSAAPLYLRTDAYRHILGELEQLRSQLHSLQLLHTHLQSSEYNEERNFTKLRRAVRGTHDRLLQVDKILFKG